MLIEDVSAGQLKKTEAYQRKIVQHPIKTVRFSYTDKRVLECKHGAIYQHRDSINRSIILKNRLFHAALI